MTRPALLLLVGLAAAVALGQGLWSEPVGARETSRSTWPSGEAIEILGVNEAVSYPARLLATQRPSPKVLEARLAADAQAAAALGVRWTRGHTVAFPALPFNRYTPGDFARFDLWLTAVQGAGLEAVGMLGPWPGNRTQKHTARYPPAEMQGYLDYVRDLVERYDGDGIDDMPGLARPLIYWEVDNEPDLKNTGSPRSTVATDFCTPQEYGALLVATAQVIREANPKARILNGGFYRPTTPVGERYARAVFAVPGVTESVDIVSVHAYHEGPGVERVKKTLKIARELAPAKPVWLTETSVPTQGRRGALGEEGQARVLEQTVLLALEWGVERIFWHTLFDPPLGAPVPRGAMETHSLLRRGSDGSLVDKEAAHSMRRLAGWLEGVRWDEVRPEDGGVRLGSRGLLVLNRKTGRVELRP